MRAARLLAQEMSARQTPSASELKGAVDSLNVAHPDHGVKRIMRALEETYPTWRLDEQSVCLFFYDPTPPFPRPVLSEKSYQLRPRPLKISQARAETIARNEGGDGTCGER